MYTDKSQDLICTYGLTELLMHWNVYDVENMK